MCIDWYEAVSIVLLPEALGGVSSRPLVLVATRPLDYSVSRNGCCAAKARKVVISAGASEVTAAIPACYFYVVKGTHAMWSGGVSG